MFAAFAPCKLDDGLPFADEIELDKEGDIPLFRSPGVQYLGWLV